VPFIASRGSFHSEQAQQASRLLHTKYAATCAHLQRGVTYLFEIIYPQNRIVVNYGAAEELVLLAIIDNNTGLDLPLENIGFPLVKRFDGINDLQKLKALNHPNKEGFVLKFTSGFRVKVKFEEYVRLHRILTGVSNKMIWEMLKNNMPMDAILESVPDEFYDWVKKTREALMQEYTAIEAHCKNDFKELRDRKSTAMYFLSCKYPSILFSMLDKRDYSDSIWKLIKPKYEKPFAKEEGQ
jgi:RNA ligase